MILFQEEILGTSYLAADYLKKIGYKGTVYCIGSEGLKDELDQAGIANTGFGVSFNTFQLLTFNFGLNMKFNRAVLLMPIFLSKTLNLTQRWGQW